MFNVFSIKSRIMETPHLITQFFKNMKGIVSVHIFGSYAKGNANKNSDVDCAVLFDRNSIPDDMDIIQMRENLSNIINKEVDLVCRNTASPILNMQIYKHGLMLVDNDHKQYADFVMVLFTDYFDLKLFRKQFEDKILERKYYG